MDAGGVDRLLDAMVVRFGRRLATCLPVLGSSW